MNVHIETIEVLSNLHSACRKVLDEEYDPHAEGEEALEAAAIDYMTCPERDQFYSLIDNLDHAVRQELAILMKLGRDNRSETAQEDFEQLTRNVIPGPELANELFGEQRLVEYWEAAQRMLGLK